MNLQEYISTLTDAEFEELCTEYLQWIYQNKRINIHGTRLRKDGGKDAVGKAKDVPYEIWAECKRHNRAIGLDDISKNVVLVISKGINELLYFSTSNITRNAVKHISIVAAKHDFSVSFFYGEYLYQELARLPRFNEAPTSLPVRTSDTLEIVRFFSVFEDSYEYDNKNTIVLQRDNHFYIDLFLKNMYSETITDIKCILPQVRETFFSISELNNEFSMLKNSSRIIQIRGEVLNCYSIKSIPDFIIQYKINGIRKKSSVKGGFVNPTKLIYYPLTGQTRHEFLRNSIYPLFNNSATVKPYIISIDGAAGAGKSRLLSEIMSLARQNSFQTLYCDAQKQKGYEILREYLCTCLGIPYGKGNIACTLEEFHSVILRYNGSENISNAIYNFIYMEKTDASIMYYLKEALIHFSKNVVGHFLLFFVIDNIQCLSGEVLDIIYFVLYRLQNTTTKTIWGLGTNTEVIPLELKDDVTTFLKKIKEYPNTVCIQYTCDELHVNDAKTLYLHAISELQNFPLLLNALVKKSGKRPFDIIMTIHWFYDKNIIRKKEHISEKEIDINAFYQLITEIPPKSEELVMNRFKLQKSREFSSHLAISYYDAFKTIVKSILYFGGTVPIAFLETLQIYDDMQFEMNQSLFFKYDEKAPTISFYHDNIFRFFEKYTPYQNDRKLSSEIINWLDENIWYSFEMRTVVIYECYIRTCQYEKGLEFGLKAIELESKKRNFDSVVRIGNELLSCYQMKLTEYQRFFLNYAVADAYRIYKNLSESILYFDKASALLPYIEQKDFSAIDRCRFFHGYVNACIAKPCYQIALNVMENFEISCNRDEFYEFIFNNRYSVVYLALADIEKSEHYIDISLQIAARNGKKQWESISYSDKAYIYYRAYENKEKAIEYFKKAVENHIPEEASVNRSSEILAQEAFFLLLEDDYNAASDKAKRALDTAIDINGTSMEIKSRNLYAIIKCFSGNIDEAILLWHKNIIIATQRKSVEGIVKAHSNIGAAYILKGMNKKALKHLETALELFEKNQLALMSHKPLIYNLLFIYDSTEEYKKRDKLLSDKYYDNLSDFYNQLTSLHSLEDTSGYWPLQYQQVFFNY